LHSASVHLRDGTITPFLKECFMKSLIAPRTLATATLGCALFAAGSGAQADVYFSARVPIYSEPAYVQAQPVYVDPAPAIVAPYGPVYVAPQPSWEQRQEWRRRYWEHRRWERERWEREQWARRHHRHWSDGEY
jgi:hypothetical protein